MGSSRDGYECVFRFSSSVKEEVILNNIVQLSYKPGMLQSSKWESNMDARTTILQTENPDRQ